MVGSNFQSKTFCLYQAAWDLSCANTFYFSKGYYQEVRAFIPGIFFAPVRGVTKGCGTPFQRTRLATDMGVTNRSGAF